MAALRPDDTPSDPHQLVDRSASRLKIKLSDNNWKVLRFTAVQVLYRPWEVAARVRYELVQAARRQGVNLDRVQLY